MSTLNRSARVLLGAAAIALLGVVAACTPEEIELVQRAQAEQAQAAAAADANDPYRNAISDDGLAKLRHCESRGNYQAVSKTGKYRGAYQFSQSSWNTIAARYYPHLRGVDPVAASPSDQDRMTRAYWAQSGRHPWPVCGKRV